MKNAVAVINGQVISIVVSEESYTKLSEEANKAGVHINELCKNIFEPIIIIERRDPIEQDVINFLSAPLVANDYEIHPECA
jgi:hypothetical protein